MTVSASIPVAVLSITLFRAFSRAFGTRRATILENNIVQTTGSAGESIAFGVGVTMPALMILGYDMDLTRVMLVAALGGLLGILMMIPLRRAFIVKQHGTLTYPEGTACAKVLIVGEQGGLERQDGLRRLRHRLRLPGPDAGPEALAGDPVAGDRRASRGPSSRCEASPAAAGRRLHHRATGSRRVMVGGGVLAALVLTPAIAFFGANATEPLFPGTSPIGEMSPKEIRDVYILYIGAGAVAAGGDHQPVPGPAADRLVDPARASATSAPPASKATATGAGPDRARPAALARRPRLAGAGRRDRRDAPDARPTSPAGSSARR